MKGIVFNLLESVVSDAHGDDVWDDSFNYLRRLPVTVLKIDRTFVTDAADVPRDAAIVAGIVAMARALKILTVAEGVETVEQAIALQRAGIDQAQGWLFGPPCKAAAWLGGDELAAHHPDALPRAGG